MKYKDQFRNEIECTPQEYKELYEITKEKPFKLNLLDWDTQVKEAIVIINNSNVPLTASHIATKLPDITMGSSTSKLLSLLKLRKDIKVIPYGKRITYFSKIDGSKEITGLKYKSKVKLRVDKDTNTIIEFINTQTKPLYFHELIAKTGIKFNLNLRNNLISSNKVQTILIGKSNGTRKLFSPLNYREKETIKNPNNVKRMTFMNQRASSLMRQDIYMSREKAYRIAGMEWSQKGKILKVRVKEEPKGEPKKEPKPKTIDIIDEFPEIYNLEPLILMKVKDVISEIISREGRIGYFDLKSICNWDTAHNWLYFIRHFMEKKSEIASFFCVPDKFAHKRIGDYDYIIYGDGK